MSPVGGSHGHTVIKLGGRMDAFVTPRRLGKVFTELGFILARDPDTVRAPDIAFVSAERLGPVIPVGYIEGAQDLAVEVLSPDDRMSEIQEKVREYLSAGARLVWVVDPQNRAVTA